MKQRTEQEHEAKIARLIRRIARYPNSAGLFQGLGKAYYKQGKFDEAEEAFKKSLALAPDDPWTHLYLCATCNIRRQFRKAIVWSKQACALAPQLSIAYICLGDSYCGLGHFAKAAELYRRAREVDPSDDLVQKCLDHLEGILSRREEPEAY